MGSRRTWATILLTLVSCSDRDARSADDEGWQPDWGGLSQSLTESSRAQAEANKRQQKEDEELERQQRIDELEREQKDLERRIERQERGW
jgi:hypothetical protein